MSQPNHPNEHQTYVYQGYSEMVRLLSQYRFALCCEVKLKRNSTSDMVSQSKINKLFLSKVTGGKYEIFSGVAMSRTMSKESFSGYPCPDVDLALLLSTYQPEILRQVQEKIIHGRSPHQIRRETALMETTASQHGISLESLIKFRESLSNHMVETIANHLGRRRYEDFNHARSYLFEEYIAEAFRQANPGLVVLTHQRWRAPIDMQYSVNNKSKRESEIDLFVAGQKDLLLGSLPGLEQFGIYFKCSSQA